MVEITGARTSDNSILERITPESGAFYIMDRGYIHAAPLYRLTLAAAFFVVRTRKNMLFRRRYSRPVDKSTGLRSDQTILLTGKNSALDYPLPARRVRYFDQEQHRSLVFLSNNFVVPALTISQLYQARWRVELSFAGSNNTCASSPSTAPQRMPSRPRSGPRFRSTCWSPSSKNTSRLTSVSTKSYRF